MDGSTVDAGQDAPETAVAVDVVATDGSDDAGVRMGTDAKDVVRVEVAMGDTGSDVEPDTDPADRPGPCGDGLSACNEGAPPALACVDLANDPQNCGSCGFVCSVDPFVGFDAGVATCVAGVCVCPSAAVDRCAFGQCTSLHDSHANCGTCGNGCSPMLVCLAGVCRPLP